MRRYIFPLFFLFSFPRTQPSSIVIGFCITTACHRIRLSCSWAVKILESWAASHQSLSCDFKSLHWDMELRCTSDTLLNLAAMEITLMHPKELSTLQRAKLCRMVKVPWIEMLCTVWSGINPDSGPQVGPAVLTHSSSRAGGPYGSMTRILSLQCFIARSVSFVEKKVKISLRGMFKPVFQTSQKAETVHSHEDGWCV